MAVSPHDEVQYDDPDATLVQDAVATFLSGLGEVRHEPRAAWAAAFDAGLSRVSFAVGEGGLGVRRELQWIVDRALARAGVPSNFPVNISGIAVVAPVVAAFGTVPQRQRYLRRIFTCEDIWCQLFSEPDAGSDLGSLRTRAVRDGDGWTITGRKVWNTMAHVSDHGLLLARTSDAERHKGITCFSLDMRAPGVDVRPLRQMTGDAEFNEVVLDGVFVPDADRIGEVDEGWKVALGTLMHERFAVNQVLDNEVPEIDEIVELWRAGPPTARRPAQRDQLLRLVIRARVLDLMRGRVVAKEQAGVPGPEGSLVKLLQAELVPDIFDLGVDLLGAVGMLYGSYAMHQPSCWSDAGVKRGDVPRAFLRSRAYPIEGGTAEIQRNVIAERVLGLPRG